MHQTCRARHRSLRAPLVAAGAAAALLAVAAEPQPAAAQAGRPGVRTESADPAVTLPPGSQTAGGEAAYQTGLRYHLGREVPRDEAEAARWFRRAAEQGHGRAMYQLGVIYSTGRGLPRDYAEAYRWYTAAQQRLSGAEQRQAQSAAWMTSQLLAAGVAGEPAAKPAAPAQKRR